MSPMLREENLFLKENCDLCSIKDVPEAVRQVKQNKKIVLKKRIQNYQEEEAQIAIDAGSSVMQQTIAPVVYDDGNSN